MIDYREKRSYDILAVKICTRVRKVKAYCRTPSSQAVFFFVLKPMLMHREDKAYKYVGLSF